MKFKYLILLLLMLSCIGYHVHAQVQRYDSLRAGRFILLEKRQSRENKYFYDVIKKNTDALWKMDSSDHAKYGSFQLNALHAIQEADIFFDYLQSVKDIIAFKSGGWADSDKTIINDDVNLEISTKYFLKEKHGKKLRDSLNLFAKKMKPFSRNEGKYIQMLKWDTQNPPKGKDGTIKTWEEYYWDGVPSIAAITELTKFQQDVLSAEKEVVNYNYKKALELKEAKK